jgi:hypothetical protein
MYLAGFKVLHEEPFEDGRVVIFRTPNPLVDRFADRREQDLRSTAILLFARRDGSGCAVAGGGVIGTVVLMDRHAVACAWTWLRFAEDAPTVAAFYCTVEDPRVAAIELETVEGHTWRAEVNGQRAVVFPYAWDLHSRWPAQQPRALRLFAAAGRPLELSTSLRE